MPPWDGRLRAFKRCMARPCRSCRAPTDISEHVVSALGQARAARSCKRGTYGLFVHEFLAKAGVVISQFDESSRDAGLERRWGADVDEVAM